MKTFYGGTFISKNKLEEANIYNPVKLEYYKIKNVEKEEYGIEVVKTQYTKETTFVESKTVEKITEDEKVVDKVLDLFKKNYVTPVSVRELLEDLLLKQN